MTELLRARCKQGKLIITDEAITIELPSFSKTRRSETIERPIVALDTEVISPAIFGKGGGANLTFTTTTAELKANWVSDLKNVRAIEALLAPDLAQFTNVDPVSLIIHQVQTGQFKPISTSVNLHKDEIVLFATQATLAEDRTTSRRVGSSSGISVPVGHGIRLHAGSFQSHAVSTTNLTKIEQGYFTVTTQRLIFTGTHSSIVLSSQKILNTLLYKDGVEVRAENRQKREVFLCNSPKLLNIYILAAMRLSTKQ